MSIDNRMSQDLERLALEGYQAPPPPLAAMDGLEKRLVAPPYKLEELRPALERVKLQYEIIAKIMDESSRDFFRLWRRIYSRAWSRLHRKATTARTRLRRHKRSTPARIEELRSALARAEALLSYFEEHTDAAPRAYRQRRCRCGCGNIVKKGQRQ